MDPNAREEKKAVHPAQPDRAPSGKMSRNRVLRAPGSWGDFFLFLESEIESRHVRGQHL
jgi:hypothetical protein